MELLEGTEKYNSAFSNFNEDDLFKLFIAKKALIDETGGEGSKHDLDRILGEGYYSAMENAFDLMKIKVGQRIDITLLTELHDAFADSFQNIELGRSPGFIRWNSELIDQKAIKELTDSRILFYPQAIYQDIANGKNIVNSIYLISFLEHVRPLYFSAMLKSLNGQVVIKSLSGDKKQTMEKIELVVNHYYEQLDQIKTLKGKLAAIAELLRALEIFHLFSNGNQQVFAFLLLNKLLIENNIPPAILEDGRIFSGRFSLDNMVDEIYNGILNFLNNDSEMQRLFFSIECRCVTLENQAYFNSSDYYPFYKKNLGGETARTLRNIFVSEISYSINLGKINDFDGSLSPLSKAIIIADDELVDELLLKGAKVVLNSEIFMFSPVIFAIDYFNYEIAKKVFLSQELLSLSPYDLGAIFSRMELFSQKSEEIIRKQMGKCLELLIFRHVAYFFEKFKPELALQVKERMNKRFLDDSIEPIDSNILKEIITNCNDIYYLAREFEIASEQLSKLITDKYNSVISELS